MLDKDLTSQLTDAFARLNRQVSIRAMLDERALSGEMLELLTTLAGLSEHIVLERGALAGAQAPTFSLTTPGQDIEVRFAGLPMGHEFTSLVLAIMQVGGHPAKIDAETIDQIVALDEDMVFETYYSQSCHNCPDVVQALNLMSVLNPRVRHTAIDGGAFADEVQARGVMAVPTVFLNGEMFDSGRMDLAQILSKVDTQGDKRRIQGLADKDMFDVLVVGGGPAGVAAAIYSARKGISTGLVAGRLGGQVQDTLAIENLISVVHTEGPQLAGALERHLTQYDVDTITGLQATKLQVVDGVVRVQVEGQAELRARSVILAPGARWRQMGVPGEDEYRNKGVAYCPHCDGPLFKGKPVAVVGGGNSGVEAAIDLAGIASSVVLLEFDSKLRADEVLQKKLRTLGNVRVVLNTMTTEVVGDGKRVNGLVYQDRTDGGTHTLALEGIFVQIGLLPNTEWLDGAVELTGRGEIVIDTHGGTSATGVFAAGDATTVPYKQIVIAMGDGSKAALSAFDHLIRQ